MKIKICEWHDGALSLPAIHVMLKVAQLRNLGAYVRVYALDADGNPAKVWLQDSVTMPRPVTSFPEWGIEFENGIVCNAVGRPKNPDGPVMTTRMIAKVQPNPAKQRDTEHLCSICRRQFKEHSDEEFSKCWKELMIQHDMRSISNAEGPNYAYGPVVLMRASQHLRETHGAHQEAEAIKLLTKLGMEVMREAARPE